MLGATINSFVFNSYIFKFVYTHYTLLWALHTHVLNVIYKLFYPPPDPPSVNKKTKTHQSNDNQKVYPLIRVCRDLTISRNDPIRPQLNKLKNLRPFKSTFSLWRSFVSQLLANWASPYSHSAMFQWVREQWNLSDTKYEYYASV